MHEHYLVIFCIFYIPIGDFPTLNIYSVLSFQKNPFPDHLISCFRSDYKQHLILTPILKFLKLQQKQHQTWPLISQNKIFKTQINIYRSTFIIQSLAIFLLWLEGKNSTVINVDQLVYNQVYFLLCHSQTWLILDCFWNSGCGSHLFSYVQCLLSCLCCLFPLSNNVLQIK